MSQPVYWRGSPIRKCDLCSMPIQKEFVDGKTLSGPWGILCPACHRTFGYGVGTGRGQRYQLQENGSWLKVEG